MEIKDEFDYWMFISLLVEMEYCGHKDSDEYKEIEEACLNYSKCCEYIKDTECPECGTLPVGERLILASEMIDDNDSLDPVDEIAEENGYQVFSIFEGI